MEIVDTHTSHKHKHEHTHRTKNTQRHTDDFHILLGKCPLRKCCWENVRWENIRWETVGWETVDWETVMESSTQVPTCTNRIVYIYDYD